MRPQRRAHRPGACGATGAVFLAAWLVALGLAGPVAAFSADEIVAQISEAYGIRVIDVRSVTTDGRAAYLLTVMNPGGDYNEAFQVTRLLVDAESGRLIPRFRHNPAGYTAPDARADTIEREDGEAIRRRSLGR